jgi:hypothetical protein
MTMGLFDRKPAKVRGTFTYTTFYDPHPHSTGSGRFMLTGVVSAPGIAPVASEALSDWNGKWSKLQPGDTIPAIVDPSDPSRCEIPWKELHPESAKDLAREAAVQAAQGGPGTGAAAGAGGATVSFVVDPRMAEMMPGLAGFGQAGGATGGVLRVAAVGTPSMPSGPEDVLVTGLLLDPMMMQLVQVTAGLPAALRPNPGTELQTVDGSERPPAQRRSPPRRARGCPGGSAAPR